MRRIAVATFARSEYSSLRPILRGLFADPSFDPLLIVSGAHLDPEFGSTVSEIENDGFPISARIPMPGLGKNPAVTATAVGLAMGRFAALFESLRPDVLLLVGDRLEILAPVTAALPMMLPVAHISGGDVTDGAIDNQVRHAVSKMSHIHFVAMEEHANRLRQMGEEEWRIHITGDPALDDVVGQPRMDKAELERSLGFELNPPIILVTYHPPTLQTPQQNEIELGALIDALAKLVCTCTIVITAPGADNMACYVGQRLKTFAGDIATVHFVESLGHLRYCSLMAIADAMLGNSSSGIWEAPSFRLPVVNVGARQRGRMRAGNVIDARPDAESINSCMSLAMSSGFRDKLGKLINPYGDGHASTRIVSVLAEDYDIQGLLIKGWCRER